MRYKNFLFSVSDIKRTEIPLVCVTDEKTGFVVRTPIPNPKHQTASIMAFAGARFSRSNLSAEEIFAEVKASGANAQEKLANIFNNYGHSSVGDMALLFVYIEQIPDWMHVKFFYDSRVGAGQARSTRFQNFSKSFPPSLLVYGDNFPTDFIDKYNAVFQSEIKAYAELQEVTYEEFKKAFKIDDEDRRSLGALKARTLDCSRALLPMGCNTSLAYITSAREWARIICELKSDSHKLSKMLGDQLEILLSPPHAIRKELKFEAEAPDLITFTDSNDTMSKCVNKIEAMFHGLQGEASQRRITEHFQKISLLSANLKPHEIALYQTLLCKMPKLSASKFKRFLKNFSNPKILKLSKVMFDDFDHHVFPSNSYDLSSYSFKISASFSELKDLNRHRAWGKFSPLWECKMTNEFLRDGFVLSLYLNIPRFKNLKRLYIEKLKNVYSSIRELYSMMPDGTDERFLLNLLPQSHRTEYYFHGGPKEISYMTHLRIRRGGHINYRMLAYKLAEVIGNRYPLLSGLKFPTSERPNPASKEEFLDRT